MARTRLTLLKGRLAGAKIIPWEKIDRNKFEEIQDRVNGVNAYHYKRLEAEKQSEKGTAKSTTNRSSLTAGDKSFFNLVRMQNNGTLTTRATTGSSGG